MEAERVYIHYNQEVRVIQKSEKVLELKERDVNYCYWDYLSLAKNAFPFCTSL